MKKIVEYKIISGSVIEIKRGIMNVSGREEPKKRRAPRVAGSSSLRKIVLNEIESTRKLARLINCNFVPGDSFLTLKYSNKRLPETKEEADKLLRAFLRKLRAAMKKEGRELHYIICTSETSTKNKGRARLHHHIIMDRVDYELIKKLWPEEEFYLRFLDGRKDYTSLAQYIIKNASGEANKKRWRSSQNLLKPIVTEPEIVPEVDKIKAPKGAVVHESYLLTDEETGMQSAYLRAVLPTRPKVRGGRVIFPKEVRK